MNSWSYFIKSIFDYLIVIFFIPIWIPLLCLLAIIIKVADPKYSVFFIQKRIGRKGISFKMIKFRSMVPNQSCVNITSKNDKRITKVGSILRRLKLDELPELLNILKGDMSLVGPRPDVPGYADKLDGDDKIILSVKPGITGPASILFKNEEELLAQQFDPVKYNNEILWPQKIEINKRYISEYSLLADLKYLIKTVF